MSSIRRLPGFARADKRRAAVSLWRLPQTAHQEIGDSATRINETIAPYRRFVETQRARLNEARGELVATEDALLRLKSEIERA